MNFAQLSSLDLAGALVGFLLTLMLFSYILGDNPLFRIAIHIFIGVAAGYALVLAVYNVIWPQLILPLVSGTRDQRLLLMVPLLLSALLIMKVSPRLASWGNAATAFLVGAGAATVISGALLGTLFPQALTTMSLFDGTRSGPVESGLIVLLEGVIILAGTLTTLVYFQFEARPQPDGITRRAAFVEGVSRAGGIFIAAALGAVFAGVFTAALSALVERVQFIVSFFGPMIFPQ
ncbi:MAG: hypothetical protein GX495_09830 [Chloroflexi bacterium]|jgi:hypothetical protein|nr:hypothetical protein [Chloroflexota bacterium]